MKNTSTKRLKNAVKTARKKHSRHHAPFLQKGGVREYPTVPMSPPSPPNGGAGDLGQIIAAQPAATINEVDSFLAELMPSDVGVAGPTEEASTRSLVHVTGHASNQWSPSGSLESVMPLSPKVEKIITDFISGKPSSMEPASPESTERSSAMGFGEPMAAPDKNLSLKPRSDEDLHSIIPRDWRGMAKELGADSTWTTCSMISAASAAAGKDYVLKDGDRETYPNLYLVIGSPPGSGKTIMDEQVMPSIGRIQRMRMEHIVTHRAPRLEKLRTQLFFVKQRLIKRGKDQDDSENIGDISDQLVAVKLLEDRIKEKSAESGVFCVNDVTPAGLKRDLFNARGNFVSMILSDGRHALQSMDESSPTSTSNAVRQVLLNGYSGDEIRISRGSGMSHRIIENPRIGLLMQAQLDAVMEFFSLGETHESGFASRILFGMFGKGGKPRNLSKGTRSEWENQLMAIAGRVDQSRHVGIEALEEEVNALMGSVFPDYSEEIEAVVGEPTAPGSFSVEPAAPEAASTDSIEPERNDRVREVRLTDDARELIKVCEDIYSEEENAGVANKRTSAMWARAGENLRRVALCFGLLRNDFQADPCVTIDDVSQADIFINQAAGTFIRMVQLCQGTAAKPEAVMKDKLRDLIGKNGGAIRMTALKGTGISERMAEKLVDLYPHEFSKGTAKTGQRGKPPIEIRFTGTRS